MANEDSVITSTSRIRRKRDLNLSLTLLLLLFFSATIPIVLAKSRRPITV